MLLSGNGDASAALFAVPPLLFLSACSVHHCAFCSVSECPVLSPGAACVCVYADVGEKAGSLVLCVLFSPSDPHECVFIIILLRNIIGSFIQS